MNETKFDAYLARFGGSRDGHPSLEALESLVRAHVTSIPFENFDVMDGIPISLDVPRFYAKIVENRRGGFCYELNGLFQSLLRHLGYDVILLQARVRNSVTKILYPKMSHVTMSVALPHAPANETRYLVDVAFADALCAPLRLVDGIERAHPLWDVRLTASDDDWTVETRDAEEWIERYRFTTNPIDSLDAFAGMLRYHTTDPEAPFMTARVCTLLGDDDGRLIFTDRGDDGPRLIEMEPNRGAEKRVNFLKSAHEVKDVMLKKFNIVVE
ncbi:arylamine N-acetyltransferase-like [Oscarella lobularis]|uniref:arylamine N-acetyltransferase-like n=1 Tax=Oscarella lobularis TaxID=121494 RepID=UPI003313A63B